MLRAQRATIVLPACVLLAAAGGCGNGDGGKPTGTEGGPCYQNKTCNTGLTCVNELCVKQKTDARPDGPTVGDGKPDVKRDVKGADLPPPKKCEPACTSGSCCSGTCANLATDPQNCGKCGTSCKAGEKCVSGSCKSCTPSCSGKTCGPDGCGGACGQCKASESCDPKTGNCIACPAIPICGARVCGDDGCGHSCGTCKPNEKCVNGKCGTPQPSCSGKDCGDPDGAGGFCQSGPCPGGGSCKSGKCDATCKPSCAGKECGNDGCGGMCGTCSGHSACDSSGKCACSPWCALEGRTCGPDGCGGSCGGCGSGEFCSGSGQCVCDPMVAGCSDGTREGFAKTGSTKCDFTYKDIAGCQAVWSPAMSLRTTETGVACGNSIGACKVPADACAPGWHICMGKGYPGDIKTRITRQQCMSADSGTNAFMAASDAQGNVPLGCACWGSCGPACCGLGCSVCNYCSGIWPADTPMISANCSSVASAGTNGVLCCKNPESTNP